jgi:hypothetical protein
MRPGDLAHNHGDEVCEYQHVYDIEHVEPVTSRQMAEEIQ